jgi:hypothetical protein
MLNIAFKEWAVICRALAIGKQALILRKGGIAETTEEFEVENRRFWLYPTWTHQQADGIQSRAEPLLRDVETQKPPPGMIQLTHFAEVTGIYYVRDLLMAQLLAHLHFWSDETVQKRFAYKQPGLHVLVVRVYQGPETYELPALDRYEGCRSWVELERELPTEPATPVLSAEALSNLQRNLDLLLNPTAFA